MRVRQLTLGTLLAAQLLSVGLISSGQIKVIGFPQTKRDTVTAQIALISGIARERVEAVVQQLLDGLDEVDAELTPATEAGQPAGASGCWCRWPSVTFRI